MILLKRKAPKDGRLMNHKKNTITEQVFAKLGKERLLHEYSHCLYGLLGLIIDFITWEGETLKLSGGTNFNPFCQQIRDTQKGQLTCQNCDETHARWAARNHKSVCYRCHAGLTDVLVPLYDHANRYIGSMTAGQFHREGDPEFSREQIYAIAKDFDLDPQTLYHDYCTSPRLTQSQLEALLDFLNIIGRHLSSTHDNLLLLEKLNTPDKIESVRKYVEDNYRKQLSIRQVARHFGISPGYLAYLFKRELYVSFGNYLNFYRISKAREMLTETRLSVSEIAFLNGFGSISQFNRTFRKVLHCSPSDYRASCL